MADTGELKPGMLLGGCRIERLLGSGGMGEVYLAEHLVLEKRVAIKTARAKLQNQQQARERFLKEARLAAKVDHQNVITIYDAGDLNGLLYIVMQFVEGCDLAQVLKTAPAPLEWPLVLTWIRDAAKGLEAVHKRGLIHRDIKPHNIMLTPEGRVLVMDFGLVREDDPDASMTSGIVGSPAYMSPEQCRSERLDHRTDIYSLGTTAYNLLSGNPPFLEKSVHLVIMKLASNAVAPRLDRLRADIPAEVGELLARTMEPHRDQRIADAHTLVLELDHQLQRVPVVAAVARQGSGSALETGVQNSSRSSSADLSSNGSRSSSRVAPSSPVIETANSSVRDTRSSRLDAPAVPATLPRQRHLAGLLVAVVLMAGLIGVTAWGAGLFRGPPEKQPQAERKAAAPSPPTVVNNSSPPAALREEAKPAAEAVVPIPAPAEPDKTMVAATTAPPAVDPAPPNVKAPTVVQGQTPRVLKSAQAASQVDIPQANAAGAVALVPSPTLPSGGDLPKKPSAEMKPVPPTPWTIQWS